jgi:hypothetical protein
MTNIKHLNPKTTSMMDIFDYLGKSPEMIVRLQGSEQTLTYERVNDDRGFMKAVRLQETGEIIPLPY